MFHRKEPYKKIRWRGEELLFVPLDIACLPNTVWARQERKKGMGWRWIAQRETKHFKITGCCFSILCYFFARFACPSTWLFHKEKNRKDLCVVSISLSPAPSAKGLIDFLRMDRLMWWHRTWRSTMCVFDPKKRSHNLADISGWRRGTIHHFAVLHGCGEQRAASADQERDHFFWAIHPRVWSQWIPDIESLVGKEFEKDEMLQWDHQEFRIRPQWRGMQIPV